MLLHSCFSSDGESVYIDTNELTPWCCPLALVQRISSESTPSASYWVLWARISVEERDLVLLSRAENNNRGKMTILKPFSLVSYLNSLRAASWRHHDLKEDVTLSESNVFDKMRAAVSPPTSKAAMRCTTIRNELDTTIRASIGKWNEEHSRLHQSRKLFCTAASLFHKKFRRILIHIHMNKIMS